MLSAERFSPSSDDEVSSRESFDSRYPESSSDDMLDAWCCRELSRAVALFAVTAAPVTSSLKFGFLSFIFSLCHRTFRSKFAFAFNKFLASEETVMDVLEESELGCSFFPGFLAEGFLGDMSSEPLFPSDELVRDDGCFPEVSE